eukprot:m51a1_g3317 hypothetical protein (560) ;mRNA; r:347170-349075
MDGRRPSDPAPAHPSQRATAIAVTLQARGMPAIFHEVASCAVGQDGAARVCPLPASASNVQLRSLTDASASLVWASLVPRPHPDRLLADLVGRDAEFEDGSAGVWRNATVAAVEGDLVATRSPDGAVVVRRACDVRGVRVPAGAAEGVAALELCLATAVHESHVLELAYTVPQPEIQHVVEYVGVVDCDAAFVELDGAVLVSNKTGRSLDKCSVTLQQAGEAEGLWTGASVPPRRKDRFSTRKSAAVSSFSKKSFTKQIGDPGVHSYVIPGSFDLPDGIETRIQFCSLRAPARLLTLVRAQRPQEYGREINLDKGPDVDKVQRVSVEQILQFEYMPSSECCASLPAGEARFYARQSAAGAPLGLERFVETRIPRTETNGHVRVCYGLLPGVVAERKRMEFKLEKKDHILCEAFSIVITSEYDDSPAGEVVVEEELSRWPTWNITSLHPHERASPTTVRFTVTLPGGKQQTPPLVYTVSYTGWVLPEETPQVVSSPSPSPRSKSPMPDSDGHKSPLPDSDGRRSPLLSSADHPVNVRNTMFIDVPPDLDGDESLASEDFL